MLRVVGDVIAVVAQRRGIERQQPQRRDTEILQVIELAAQPLEIADPIVVGVEERLDVQLIDDRVLVPQRVDESRARDVRRSREQRRWSVVGWGHAASASKHAENHRRVGLRIEVKALAGAAAGDERVA